RREQEIVRYFDKGWAARRCCCDDCVRDVVGRADARSESRERLEDFKLLWSFMQRTTCLFQNLRSYVGPDEHQWCIGLKTFQQWRNGEQVSRPCRGKYSRNLAGAAIETISGKSCRLFVAHDPVPELRLLAQRVVEGDVVNAGNSEACRDSAAKQGVYDCPGCADLSGLRRSMRGWGHHRSESTVLPMGKTKNKTTEV